MQSMQSSETCAIWLQQVQLLESYIAYGFALRSAPQLQQLLRTLQRDRSPRAQPALSATFSSPIR